MADYIVLQRFQGVVNGRLVKWEPSTLINDTRYNIDELKSTGCSLMLYNPATMDPARSAFQALARSNRLESITPVLRSFNVGEDVETVDARITSLESGAIMLTSDGGIAVPLVNKTGATTVKGTVVEASSTTDAAFQVATADDPDPIGVVYEAGVADGESALVTIQGVALTLLQDSTASTRGYWVRLSSTQAGRADATNATPPGGTVANLEIHLKEIGHAMSTETAGTDVLAKILLHFN